MRLGLAAFGAIVNAIVEGASDLPVMSVIILLVLAIVGTVVDVAVTVRRLHDLNRSGWWLLGYYLIACTLSMVGVLIDSTVATASFIIVAALMFLGLFVWLGFFRGTKGKNDFGLDPL